MALLDIFKKGSKKPYKSKKDAIARRPKGALNKPASAKVVESESAPEAEKKEIKLGQSELASLTILRPHVTEKSAGSGENSVYSFIVSPRANKVIVKRAIRELYGFDPLRIRILNMPQKPRRVRGKVGHKPGYKKAIVYLKKEDKIELV